MKYADTNGNFSLELQKANVNNYEYRSTILCGNETKCAKGSVDYISVDVEKFRFNSTCITKDDIHSAKLMAGSTDGWYVAGIFVFVDTCGETTKLLTSDPRFNKWIDDDSNYSSRLEQSLTLVG